MINNNKSIKNTDFSNQNRKSSDLSKEINIFKYKQAII